MFTSRSALPALRAARGQFVSLPSRAHSSRQNRTQARLYSTAPPQAGGGGSNLPLILGLAGVGGLGYYVYLTRWANPPSRLEQYLASADPKLWAEATPADPGINSNEWTKVIVKDVQRYNHDTSILELGFMGDKAGDKTSGLTVSSCLLVRSPQGPEAVKEDNGKPAIRPYTPISPPGHRGSLDLMIKSYPDGKISKWFGSLQPGDHVLLKGPMIKIPYKPNNVERAVFIAGGSGITPAWQLINHAMALPNDKTKFTLIYANKNEKDILLRKEWDALAAKYPNRFEVIYFLDNAPSGWKGESGFVTAEHVMKYFPRKQGEKVMAYVCGPPGQYKAISGAKDGKDQGELGGALKDLGYTKEEVFKF